MEESSYRYIGDMIFDALTETEGFKETVRPLIEADWRTGSNTFQSYVEPLIDGLPFEAIWPSYGKIAISYLESRLMEGIDLRDEPWLWAYKQMVGALIDPATVRSALNAIENSAK